jgi:hypothetical protein
VIYIESLASRPPLTFWKNNESSRKERNVKQFFFEALQHVAIMGGFEKTLGGLWKHYSPPPPAFIIISDFEEEG